MSRQTTTRRRHGVRRMSERKRLTITAITAVLALVTVVICALSGVFNFHKGNERILPNLVGQTEESAKAQLAELDAEPSITYENSDETKGIVIRQDVNEGTQLKHRQTVAFVVSLGPKEQPTAPEDTPVAIPSFVGLTLEQAQATAKSLGVTVEESGNVYDDNVQKGSVARQNPVGGTMVKPGTTIQVSISAGPEKKEFTVTVTYENSDETKGIVIRQDVNEGTQLKHRQTVAFVVSLGPKEQPTAPEDTPVAIPSFVGLTLEQAQATAKSLGVTVEESGNVYDDNVQKGSVARQNPVGGTMVKPGTTIQVSISAGPEKKEYTVTVTCGAGGSVSPSGNQKVAEGGSVSFTITPKDGYEVATLVIDGTTVLPLTSYSFMNVDSNHTLYVTFREK